MNRVNILHRKAEPGLPQDIAYILVIAISHKFKQNQMQNVDFVHLSQNTNISDCGKEGRVKITITRDPRFYFRHPLLNQSESTNWSVP